MDCPRWLSLPVLALGLACVPAGGGPGPGPGGGGDAGQDRDGGSLDASPRSRFTWVPVEGTACGSGSTAGFGLDATGPGEELFIYLQGGGACWNQGTCVPSLQQFGPLCDYGNLCAITEAGGQLPTSTHVIAADPFPRDGGGAFPAEIAQFASSRLVLREDVSNPFRAANFVFIPYCTGDLHSGNATREYRYQYGLFDPVSTYTMHFRGAVNVEKDLLELASRFPSTRRIWLTGSSAGGYGATLHLETAKRIFPSAEVHLLADSSPMLDTVHWTQWRDTWQMQLPADCQDCDAGLPRVMAHLQARHTDSRLGLLAFGADRTVAWFFLAGAGLGNFLDPPVGAYQAGLGALLETYDAREGANSFVLPGEGHVMWPGYGIVRADGSITAPLPSADGGTHLKAWIDAWATGDGGWTSAR